MSEKWTAEALTIEKLEQMYQEYRSEPVPSDVTVSPADFMALWESLYPDKDRPYLFRIRVHVDYDLCAGEWHWGPPTSKKGVER